MLRETLNTYTDGLVGLALDPDAKNLAEVRRVFIEEGAQAENCVELLEEWIWIHNLRESEAHKIKVWLGLNYLELATAFHRTVRDIAQLLRNQRSEALPSYPSHEQAQDNRQIAGLSCFMVEQNLSAWLDQEFLDSKTGENIILHTQACPLCRERLQVYRDQHSQLLANRPNLPPISEEEWDKTQQLLSQERRRRLLQVAAVIFVVLAISIILAWVLWAKPERMPNIYELPDA